MAKGAIRRRPSLDRLAASRLTVRIVLTNIIGLAILLLASFGVTQYRDGLVAAKIEGVRAQAQIVADVLSQVAITQDDCSPLEQEVQSGAEISASEPIAVCARTLNEANVRDVFNRVWTSFEGRIRIFRAPDLTAGAVVTDARSLLLEDVVLRADAIRVEALPPIEEVSADRAVWGVMAAGNRALRNFMTGEFRREAQNRSIEAELNDALRASPFADEPGASGLRINENGEIVASVSVPIRKVQAIHGIVTSEIGGIDDLIADSRLAILPFFWLAIAATILSSLLLTATIVQPIRQLAFAADRVREGIAAAGRARIPDFRYRRDEIGELSVSLETMTQAIYERIDAIERFAADVAHELKNPLTSIRSAAETLEIAKNPEAREKLMAVIRKDVARMDRLITDISNASRLDAELARESRDAVDLRKLLTDIAELYQATQKENAARVEFDPSGAPVYLFGNATALGQVFRNLIDNARSFSPPNGAVRLRLALIAGEPGVARVFVDDDGPGVPPDALEKIFERFYTKRPSGAAFGNNSGLGLAISRQIAVSHGGALWAENRTGPGGEVLGARFIVELPRAG